MVSHCVYKRESPLAVSQELAEVLLISAKRDFEKIKLFPCFSVIYLLISPGSSIKSCRVSFSDNVSKCNWFMRKKIEGLRKLYLLSAISIAWCALGHLVRERLRVHATSDSSAFFLSSSVFSCIQLCCYVPTLNAVQKVLS